MWLKQIYCEATYAQDIKDIYVLSDLVIIICARISSRWCFTHYFKTDAAIITRYINISSFFQVNFTSIGTKYRSLIFHGLTATREIIRRIYWNNEAVMFYRRKCQVFKHISTGVLIREQYHAWTATLSEHFIIRRDILTYSGTINNNIY